MLKISLHQVRRLEQALHVAFVARLDSTFCEDLGETWSQMDAVIRHQTLQLGCYEGLKLGIGTELQLAQFTLLYVLRGEALLQDPDATAILSHSRLNWRQKLFQLTHLLGLNLDDDAEGTLK